jgi:hypothetical protein
VPVRLYALLREQNLIPPAIGPAYRAKIDKAWQWLLAHTSPETFPEDGYEKVTGRTTKKPLENLVWLMAWTIEALLDGARSIGA